MLEQLVSLLQTEGRKDIIDNPAIPNERNEEAMGVAAETVMSGLKNALSNGQLNDVVGLFTGKSDGCYFTIKILINFKHHMLLS